VFSSIEEEAEFWDTHSLEDFADELEEVNDFHIDAFLSDQGLLLRLTDEQREELEKIAEANDTNIGDIVFQLIDERIAADRKSS